MRLILVFCLFLFSNHGHSSLITLNGYTLNENTNIVTGKSLEWLQWDETITTSDSYLNPDVYNQNGWRIASFEEVSNLLTSFGIYLAEDNHTADTYFQSFNLPTSKFSELQTLFGQTQAAYNVTALLFGDNENGDNWFNKIEAVDGTLNFYGESLARWIGTANGGVALVREPTPVSEPKLIVLFSVLCLLLSIARKERLAPSQN